MKDKIFDILELGLKDDGNSFYSNEDKIELIIKLIESRLPSAIDLARECDHDCGGVYFDYSEQYIIDQVCK
jgi:hypothetical protein